MNKKNIKDGFMSWFQLMNWRSYEYLPCFSRCCLSAENESDETYIGADWDDDKLDISVN